VKRQGRPRRSRDLRAAPEASGPTGPPANLCFPQLRTTRPDSHFFEVEPVIVSSQNNMALRHPASSSVIQSIAGETAKTGCSCHPEECAPVWPSRNIIPSSIHECERRQNRQHQKRLAVSVLLPSIFHSSTTAVSISTMLPDLPLLSPRLPSPPSPIPQPRHSRICRRSHKAHLFQTPFPTAPSAF
jgi:hypothetical protein